jgi:hypothetical protein
MKWFVKDVRRHKSFLQVLCLSKYSLLIQTLFMNYIRGVNMRIIIEVDSKYSQDEAIAYFKSINIDDELIKSIKFESEHDEEKD